MTEKLYPLREPILAGKQEKENRKPPRFPRKRGGFFLTNLVSLRVRLTAHPKTETCSYDFVFFAPPRPQFKKERTFFCFGISARQKCGANNTVVEGRGLASSFAVSSQLLQLLRMHMRNDGKRRRERIRVRSIRFLRISAVFFSVPPHYFETLIYK